MIFGRNKKPSEAGKVLFRDWNRDGRTSRDVPPPVRTLVSFLEDFGRYAFDLHDTDWRTVRKRSQQWAQHILDGSPPPGGGQETQEPHWRGVQDFVKGQRRSERRYVESSVRDLRSVIWEFVHGLSGAMGDNRESDTQVEERLERLKEAAQGESIDTLKREVGEAVVVIGRALQERRQRRRHQMKALGRKLRLMRSELLRVRREMDTDTLTRLYNRSAFEEQLKRIVDLSLFFGQTACLLMVDADHFKSINDEHGHPAGDQVLKALADQCVRTFPRKSDFVARYGGEEFGIIVNNADLELCHQMARRLTDSVREMAIDHEDQELKVTVSVGIAELREVDNPQSWLKRADQALYQAKKRGRDRVEAAA